MRPIRYIFDLPWWVGFAIFLVGNLIVPFIYIVGMPICLFGAWTFSKLMKFDEDPAIGFPLIGLPLFILAMLIPNRFAFETQYIDLLNHITPTANYAIRAALGMMTSLFACCGFRR